MILEWSAKVNRHQSQLGVQNEYIYRRSPQVNFRGGACSTYHIVQNAELQASSRAATEVSSVSRVHEGATNVNPDDRGPRIEYDPLTDEAVDEPIQLADSEVHNTELGSLLGLHEGTEPEFDAVSEQTTSSCLSGSSAILLCICSLLQIQVDKTQVHDNAGRVSKQTIVKCKLQMDLRFLRHWFAILSPWLTVVALLFM
ncbi:hypothetical protein N7474_003013 [Penicillium riverlandense]|uniref:uncharacterized protein n=1 Tax=Penicillium riverlandense TaxID=1903569 RepID=UPI00254771E2|nr:uncharacterized protein N7474_003013 [Penicillium riverlandense]KAJ5825875.1 hypothetical protein N7474_003013 [Penicillium riverlandense]